MPVDRGEIDMQLKQIGEGENWWEQREFRDLPHILHAEERIQGVIMGRVLGPRRPTLRPVGSWLIVATTQRLICLRQERFARKQVEIAAGQITRVHQSSRLRGFQITIESPQRRLRIRIPKVNAFRFGSALSSLMPDPATVRPQTDLEPLAWLPGITTVAALPGFGGIVSRIAMLSPPDYQSTQNTARLEEVVETLRTDVDRLQQQVAFLEDLLQKRAETSYLPSYSAEP